MSKSAALANAILNAIFNNTSLTAIAQAYASLHNGHPGQTGANEITAGGNSYARQAIPQAAASSQQYASNAQLEWTDTPAETIFYLGVWDALTAGSFQLAIALESAVYGVTAADTGDTFTVPGVTLTNDDRVALEDIADAPFPGGFDDSTIYYVINAAAGSFQLSLTSGGAAVAVTSDGAALASVITPKVLNAGDTFQVPSGQLTYNEF